MQKRNRGFTLIEILIVIALMAVLTGAGADLFVNSLKAYQKSQIMNQLSQNGNYVMSTVLNTARSADEISIDEETHSVLTITDEDVQTVFRIKAGAQSVGVITKQVGGGTEETITNLSPTSGVDVVPGDSRFDVTTNPPQTLTVTLKIRQAPNTPLNRAYETAITLTNSVIIRGEYL
ncbi:MAG: type II secretion system protein [bacterium]|nr:type II secretion system protein [bacterium]